ncbi:uncharacterized protein [Nicotiana tomentosiformis]|uniref:uncharacterized protein n=1 Tax=Nicotiana tomentosiformis TaxID=4098 RepID=UPI00388C9C34
MALFEALYGRRCRSPIGWFDIGEAELIGPDRVHQAMENVKIIKERLKTAHSVRNPIRIYVAGIWNSKRMIGLTLSPEMSLVHPMFHVSMLKKVFGDPTLIVPVETIEVNEEIPVAILDRHVRKLRNKEIASVKVLWKNQQVEEATWEADEGMKKK